MPCWLWYNPGRGTCSVTTEETHQPPVRAGLGADAEPDDRSADLSDEVRRLRLELDSIRRQFMGWPIERMIEGYVPDAVLAEHMARYRFAAGHLHGAVMDVACGSGFGAAYLADQPQIDYVVAADVDRDVVAYAASRYRRPRALFIRQDACAPWAVDQLDGIASFETIEHVPSPDLFLEQAARALKPDGCFVVSTPVRRRGQLADPPDWPFHLREWSASEFVSLLAQYFDDVALYTQCLSLRQDFGPIHIGRRLARRMARLSGTSDEQLHALEFDVVDPHSTKGFWLKPNPRYTVCLCRRPHAPRDPATIRALAYGR